jgi:hypothetical protein
MILGFFAACLLEWGRVFVTGADEALNGGYKHYGAAQLGTSTAPSTTPRHR